MSEWVRIGSIKITLANSRSFRMVKPQQQQWYGVTAEDHITFPSPAFVYTSVRGEALPVERIHSGKLNMHIIRDTNTQIPQEKKKESCVLILHLFIFLKNILFYSENL